MSGKKRKKPEIFLKFVEIEGRLIPLIRGASEDADGEPPEESRKDQPAPDIDTLLREKLDEQARYLGYEDWDDMQTKILEQQGKTQEYIDKLKEEYTKKLLESQKQAEEFRRKYEETVIKNALLTVANGRSVDPELVYELLSKRAVLSDGKVLIDGKSVEEAVEELLQKKPHLAKPAPPGSGAGNTSASEPQKLTYEDLLKDPQKLLEFKRKYPEEFAKLKAQYFEKTLRR